ncbi:restriction endonuclease subunit S [Collinsella sp. TM09-10AT]|uniref:restriction endonuclease subunit S n=1 Tax=Collinsella sp. TM09-10AT TaxID=2292343 RepID=UPI0018F21777|nr:restriction endonuclease subunit S [Collinsella sp. TM09-10AT]
MVEKQNTPEIRFEGFTDPWEQRKFLDVVDVCSGKDYKHLKEGSIPVYGTGGFMTSVDEALSHDRDAVGIGRKGTIDKPYLLKAPFWTVDTLFYAIPKSDIDLEFVHCSFLNVDWKSKDESTGLPSLSKEAINETIALVPSFNEQSQLGEFFNNLDTLITLHQRKHEKLCTVKKSMLDKMFPKPGETEPEIRFEGFTDPWEQRKLGELLLFQNGFNGSSESFGSGIPLISVMDVLDDEFITHETVRGKARLNYEEASRYCVEYGDVLFQRSSENQEDAGTSNVYLDQHVPSAFGGFVIRGKKVDEYNPIFIKYLLGSSLIREQITHRAQGAQHINVSQDTLADVVLLMPSMREQEAVGLVFLHLANLITLHQRKLDLLKNMKKSLLDKMFV